LLGRELKLGLAARGKSAGAGGMLGRPSAGWIEGVLVATVRVIGSEFGVVVLMILGWLLKESAFGVVVVIVGFGAKNKIIYFLKNLATKKNGNMVGRRLFTFIG
jgi:hypothetical protein